MQKPISPKIISFTLAVLLVCFGIAFYIVAWQEPSQPAPEANVPTPINTGTLPQSKAGRITATEFYDYNDPSYYLNPSGDSKISGKLTINNQLCLGADCRENWPEGGAIVAQKMTVQSRQLTPGYFTSEYGEFECPEGKVPIKTYCSEAWCVGVDACSCSINGRKATVKAFVERIYIVNGSCGAVDACQTSGNYDCITTSCSMEFFCGEMTQVGTYASAKECIMAYQQREGSSCNVAVDNQLCNSQCVSGGWQHGEVGGCIPNFYPCSSMTARSCGVNHGIPWGSCEEDRTDYHHIACRCWND